MRDDLVQRARESDILAIAREWTTLKRVSSTEFAGPCPRCGGRDRFSINTRKQLFNCRGCGAKGDVIALLMHVGDCDFPEAVERLTGGRWLPPGNGERVIAADVAEAAHGPSHSQHAAKRALASAAQYVSEIRPLISAPIALAYISDHRKIDVAAVQDVLSRTDAIGWHPAVYFNEPGHALHGQRLGAIIGVMTDARTAEPTGAISRTYLAPDGTKVGKAKTLGSPMGIGRLTSDDEVTEGLHLAEGIETALTGMAIGLRPMWSTGSSGLLANFPVLSGIEALNVILDHDANGAGEKAAREVEARWLAAGREVRLLRSDAPGDLNDALKGGSPCP
ncbi:toprim domain-containing protein [Rhodoblastus sp.]|uniref:toprim domain-containing protein n=1 Tax=Rhodoblastus sp. TaxID=1962975 RepID=UPI003F972326